MVMLLWASKFATGKIECSFEIGKWTSLGVSFILLLIVYEIVSVYLYVHTHSSDSEYLLFISIKLIHEQMDQNLNQFNLNYISTKSKISIEFAINLNTKFL